MNFRIIPSEQTPKVSPIENVSDFIKENELMLNKFLEYTERQSNCAALAANQCELKLEGEKEHSRIMKRFFVLMNIQTGWGKVIIDPVITEYTGIKRLCDEGCLTWANRRIIAERSLCVLVTYYLIDGTKIENELYRGFKAQVFQHEIDHLNGVEWRIEPNGFVLPKQITLCRNDICTCGTGKKYKNCCMLINE